MMLKETITVKRLFWGNTSRISFFMVSQIKQHVFLTTSTKSLIKGSELLPPYD